MKKILFTFLLTASTLIFAQSNSQKALYVIDGMIASEHMMSDEKSNVIKKEVYKTAENLPNDLKSFENNAQNGVISVTVKENYYDRLPLAELNRQYKLDKDNPIYFDNYIFTNTDTMIIGNAIGQVEIKEINGRKSVVINSVPKKF